MITVSCIWKYSIDGWPLIGSLYYKLSKKIVEFYFLSFHIYEYMFKITVFCYIFI